MLLAGSVDLDDALRQLSERRPIFHSEADFQFALAWQVQSMDPRIEVSLESRPEPGVHLDLAFERRDLGRSSALELKYLTRALETEVYGRRFDLKNHSALDNRRYDVVKDVYRIERFIAGRPGADGAAVVIANDPAYWTESASGTKANDLAFRLAEGAVLQGPRAWQRPRAEHDERRATITLRGRYELRWEPFSAITGASRVVEFRRLVIEVPEID